MGIPALLKRPLLWIGLFAALFAYGLYALWHIPAEVLPRFGYPQIGVVVHDPGATAEEMETLIVRPLEGQLMGLTHLRSLRSTMGQGTAQITARFDEGTDPQLDLQAVYGAIDRARGQLPAGTPPLAEVMGNAINEIADYSVDIPVDVPAYRVQRAIRTRILPALRAVPGVQRVELFGSGDEALWIQPDLGALHRYGIGITALARAVRDQIVLGPAGRLDLGHQDVLIEARHLPISGEAVRAIPVPTANGEVPLGSLARVVRAATPIHSAVELDGHPSLGLIVFKQAGASTIPVDHAVAATLARLQNQLPHGVRWVPIYRQSHLVGLIGSDLGRNLLVGGLLAIAVLLWLLGIHRGVWVLALSIPLSLLLGIAGLYAFGQSLNLLTLGALTVAVGLLADDGIIVLEAIYHRWEQGLSGSEGVRAGLGDIAGADIVGTLTTVAAYLPLLAVGGLAGLFSNPFALAMSLSLLASLLVSLTVIPLLLSRIGTAGNATRSGRYFLDWLQQGNQRLLGLTLKRPRLSALAAAGLFILSLGALIIVPVNFMPLPNEGVLLDGFTLPPGSSLGQTRLAVQQLTRRLRADPAVAHTFARIGSARGTAYTERAFAGEIQIVLKAGVDTAALDTISARLLREAATDGVQQSIDTPTIERLGESLSGLPQPFELTVYGPHLDTLRQISTQIAARLRHVSALADIFNNDSYPVPVMQVEPRPDALRAYGLNPRDFYRQLDLLLHGQTLAQVPDGEQPLALYLRLPHPQGLGLDTLRHLPLHTTHGWTPLGQLANLKMEQTPNQIRHLDGARAVDILATPMASLGTVIAAARRALQGLVMPPGYRYAFGGLYPLLIHTAWVLGLAALGALALTLGIMALQFDGLRLAGILLLQAPLAFTGGALALAVSGVGLNATGLIGFLTLIGISLNHGIVLLSYARANERAGQTPEAAVRAAVHARFRPIVLTTLTAVLGMLPTALGWGLGAAPEQGLAIVVLGGVIWSSLLSTNLLPALYLRWGHRAATSMR
ncbi:acriflavine resistance protein B [Acidihalobacter yilgarnensis]|uniref:Acriflavine resistance protein B n=1 Tax=Acidihalobacter yilgarnensis TaxID=2819280 RepID=A0A1D8ILA3_9GAMM|nr:efflux RND transporter permease subunit [Acidihalobacter yilgarnensis]AOU97205.1 acriflavine resistance protein B [Acidihalobacter yilgarnensis]